MRKNIYKDMLQLLMIVTVGIFQGCTKDENPSNDNPTSEPVPANIFPLTAGHRFEFSGYLTEGGTETPIPNSSTVFSASWNISSEVQIAAILPPSTVAHLTKPSAVLIYDTVAVTGFLVEPKFTPVFAYYDNVTKDYYYLTNFGSVFRKYKIGGLNDTAIRNDSLRFIKLASPGAGTHVKFIADSSTFVSYYLGANSPLQLHLEIVGEFKGKEELSLFVNGKDTTFTTYYLEVKNITALGESINAKFWLAEGIGPVQMFLAGDDEAPGSFRKLKAKNF